MASARPDPGHTATENGGGEVRDHERMRHLLRKHIEEAVREILDAREELVAVAALAEYDFSSTYHDFGPFGAKKVLALTSVRVLLVDYFGVVGRHVEPVAQCRRSHATATLTNICGVRLLRLDLRAGAVPTYRVYFRFARQAEAIARTLESESTRFEAFREKPGDAFRDVSRASAAASSVAAEAGALGREKVRIPTRARLWRRDQIVENLSGPVAAFGWPSAVGLFVAHKWHHLFGSNVGSDARHVFLLVIAVLGALFFGVMGLAPLATGNGTERVRGGSFLALVVLAFGPTVVLALFFYGVV